MKIGKIPYFSVSSISDLLRIWIKSSPIICNPANMPPSNKNRLGTLSRTSGSTKYLKSRIQDTFYFLTIFLKNIYWWKVLLIWICSVQVNSNWVNIFWIYIGSFKWNPYQRSKTITRNGNTWHETFFLTWLQLRVYQFWCNKKQILIEGLT